MKKALAWLIILTPIAALAVALGFVVLWSWQDNRVAVLFVCGVGSAIGLGSLVLSWAVRQVFPPKDRAKDGSDG